MVLDRIKNMAFRFENLKIWQEAIDLADLIYNIANKFPQVELFGLTSQIKRAIVSVSANIAEGSASETVKEFKMFLSYSIRSSAEVVSELHIAKNRKYISGDEFGDLYDKLEILIKKITAFKNSLK